MCYRGAIVQNTSARVQAISSTSHYEKQSAHVPVGCLPVMWLEYDAVDVAIAGFAGKIDISGGGGHWNLHVKFRDCKYRFKISSKEPGYILTAYLRDTAGMHRSQLSGPRRRGKGNHKASLTH